MPGFLRQSTAGQSRALGPFISDTDFKTAQTGLTIANTDIKLIVNGGASANKNSGGGTHRANGVYGVTFDATDTATVGEMEVSVLVSGAMLVFDKFFVLEEAVYDAWFAAGAVGYVTDQPVNATKIGGTTQSAGDIFARLGAPAGASMSADIASIKTDTGNLVTRITSTLFSGITSLANWLGAIAGKQAADATAQTEIRATGAGSGTFTATTDSLEALRDRGDAAWTTATGFSTLTSGDVSAAVWNAATASYGTAGTYGALIETNLDAALSGIVTTVNAILDDTGTSGVIVASVATGAINASALASDAANEIADALLDRADGIETGVTPRSALRYAGAAAAGVLSGAATTTVTIKGLNVATTRIQATVDADGNRSAVTLS